MHGVRMQDAYELTNVYPKIGGQEDRIMSLPGL
jgi:hypothetical protein